MPTPSELFDQIAAMLDGCCDAPEVVIRVEMDFERDPFGLRVIRHVHNPLDSFDKSRDSDLALPGDRLATIRARAANYFEISKGWPDRLLRTTLSVYPDGHWSVSSASQP